MGFGVRPRGISLDTISEYRRKLVDTGQIDKSSSILVVVGRNDTGELEAQVRGSPRLGYSAYQR
jgi:hypothetical protein